jgi:SSS family solute:Na+ symporter/sodium/pantothenate symporter
MPNDLPSPGIGTLLALILVIGVSSLLGWFAQRAVSRGSFMTSYFLGNRGLGAWTLALTATVQSGGTFMGYPSFIYSFGWVVALWIAAYMIVPITGFGILGKRLAQLSRRTGAITVPELLRARFNSPAVGLIMSTLIMFFMMFMMIAQFKAGALVMKLSWPGTGALALSDEVAADGLGQAYFAGLCIFSVTVVGYTLFGGFLASVWTDLFQSWLMLIGVVLLVCIVVPAAGGLEQATRTAVEHTGPGFASGPGFAEDGREFLPVTLAISFFFIWIFGGLGSPAGMVRFMACRDTATIRRSIILLCIYNSLIYIPLVAICVAARAVMPDLKVSDEVIPRMALWATRDWPGGSFVAGIILAAPFGAVMATVSTYLVVLASGLVRDIYQRFINVDANTSELRRVTYGVMLVLGLVAFLANVRPAAFLQALVVFSSTGQAASFVVPAIMAAFWRRATAAGVIAAMLMGSGTVLLLYIAGWVGPDPMIGPQTKIRPHFLFGFDPVVWGLFASTAAGIVVSLATRPPSADFVSQFFDARESLATDPERAILTHSSPVP